MIPAMAPLIRAAGMRDIPELVRLDREAFGEHAYSPGTTRQLLEVFDGTVLVAEDGGVACGYFFGGLAAGSKIGWMLALGVQADHRGRGVARALTEQMLARLVALGAERVRATTRPDNQVIRRLYGELGFTVVDQIEDYLGPGRDRLVLEYRS